MVNKEEKNSMCMGCQKMFNYNELIWINDNYGIPFKLSCSDCYDDLVSEVRQNNYGDDLTQEELYGEDW